MRQARAAVFAVSLALPLAGCALFRPKPPALNLHGRGGVALLPFGNASTDARLAAALADAVGAELMALRACPVHGATRTEDAAALGCDVLVVGDVRSYTEEVKADAPKRIRAVAGESAWKWGRAETCRVAVDASVTLVHASTGAVLSARRATAERTLGRWIDLAWPGDRTEPPPALSPVEGPPVDEPAPAGELRYPRDRNVARAREEAVAQAARVLLRDTRGAPGWEPPPAK